MNVYEPFSRCSCGFPYVYEKRELLISKVVPRTLKADKDGKIPGIVGFKSTLHCSQCHTVRHEVEYENN